MNELTGLMNAGGLRDQLKETINPPEPKQHGIRNLRIPLTRYATRTTQSEVEQQFPEGNSNGKLRKLNIPLQKIKEYLQKRLPKNQRNEELQNTVGFEFSDNDNFACTEYTEAVFFSVPTDELLPSQNPEKLNRRLNRLATVTKRDAARILKKSESNVTDEEFLAKKQQHELPPTAEAVVKFYVHELPKPPEQVRQGMDLIVFGGGSSDALSNIGFAGNIARELENNEQLKGKVGRIIVMPHLAGTTRTSEPLNPVMTEDFGPAAQVMIQALNQAGIKLSSELCLVGHSAGANMSILMAEGLKKSNSSLQPRLLLLDPAIGENPKIDQRMVTTGIFDPLRAARSRNEAGQRLNALQSIRYALRTIMNGWLTPDGPAGTRIIQELSRGKKPLDSMIVESAEAGFDNKPAGANQNIDLLSNDSSASARQFLADNDIPVNLVYITGSTTVDPLSERQGMDKKSLQDEYVKIQEKLESQLGLTPNELNSLKIKQQQILNQLDRNQAFFQTRAEKLFSPKIVHSVADLKGISHFDVIWDRHAIAQALLATLN
ncbi:hypothetical protein KBC89_00430 [Candidatus Woesebacteria bacterium]|nr:hypothetical protein [Candidatus Woesebacteria bacterium]